MSAASASEPASWAGATKVVGTFAAGTFAVGARDGTSVWPPQPKGAVRRRTSACAQKIRCFKVDRPKFIFDRMLVASGDILPALA